MFIYIITHPKFKGWIKLGRAVDPQKRLNSYQTHCPYRLFKMEYFINTIHPSRIENYFINYVKNNGYEWFKCSVNFAINKIEIQIKQEKSGQLNFDTFEYMLTNNNNHYNQQIQYDYLTDDKTLHSLKQLSQYLGLTQSQFRAKMYKKLFSPGKVININGHKIIRKTHEKL